MGHAVRGSGHRVLGVAPRPPDPMLTALLSDTGTFTNCTHSASSLTTTPKHAPAGDYPRARAELVNSSTGEVLNQGSE